MKISKNSKQYFTPIFKGKIAHQGTFTHFRTSTCVYNLVQVMASPVIISMQV